MSSDQKNSTKESYNLNPILINNKLMMHTIQLGDNACESHCLLMTKIEKKILFASTYVPKPLKCLEKLA